MSQENVKKFFAEIEKNQGLKTKYAEVMKDSEKALFGKIVELGKQSGFSFTEADLSDLHAAAMDKMNENGELCDSDLTAAAGGKVNPGMVLASIFTLGIACGAVSLIHGTQKPGNCKKSFEC